MEQQDAKAAYEESLKWQELGRKVIVETPVFTVTERTSRGPGGIEGRYIVNEAPDWAIAIAEDGDDFLMVTQWRHGEKALSIEFPGGVIEKGEDPEKAAARELREETGAEAKELIHLGTMNPNPALFSNHVHVFLARNLEFSEKQKLDPDEFLKCRRISKEEVLKKMGSREYPHALMSAALNLYRAYIQS